MSAIPIRSIGLLGNPDKEEIRGAIEEIIDFGDRNGLDVRLSRQLSRLTEREDHKVRSAQLVREVDVVIALGGDGTMLRAARTIGIARTPLLGINLGSLGYLTDVPLEKLRSSLERLVSGDYRLDERARVETTIWRDGREVDTFAGLNDIVVNMGPQPRALDMEVKLESVSLGRFLGDGIIVATPTGSTAYNLSAGGPICHSEVTCLLLTPLCPHSLAIRPLVVPKGEGIELLLHYVGPGAVITADGQRHGNLQAGDRLTFNLQEKQVRLVKFMPGNFYEVMRRKLNWGAPKRRGGGDQDAD